MPTAIKHDNFLADSVRPRPSAASRRLGYWDGFRFGLGLVTAWLVVALVVGGLAYAAVTMMHR